MAFRMLVFAFFQLAICSIVASAATISVSTYDPVPVSAAGPIATPPAYRLQSFGDGAYMVTDGGYQSMFFIACESVIAVDAPPTIGENIVKAIRSVTDKPISHVVYSHHHGDHISGAYLLGSPDNVTFIAHELTATELAATPDPGRPAPTITFDSSYTLTVCNQTLQLDYRGPNHDPGNIFIYAPKQKVIMLVDIVYPGWAPFNDLAESQDIPGFIKAHDQLLTYDFDHYVGGHLDFPGNRTDVLIAREYVHDLFNTSVLAINMSADANSSISFASVIEPVANKTNPHNFWLSTDLYIDVLADWVTAQLAPRWNHRLFGTDVYGKANAQTMLESCRLDYGILGPFGVING